MANSEIPGGGEEEEGGSGGWVEGGGERPTMHNATLSPPE